MLGVLEPMTEWQVEVGPLEQGKGDSTSDDPSRDVMSEVRPMINLLPSIPEPTEERRRELLQQLKIPETPIVLDQRDELTQLLLQLHDVFALTDAELGTIHLMQAVCMENAYVGV